MSNINNTDPLIEQYIKSFQECGLDDKTINLTLYYPLTTLTNEQKEILNRFWQFNMKEIYIEKLAEIYRNKNILIIISPFAENKFSQILCVADNDNLLRISHLVLCKEDFHFLGLDVNEFLLKINTPETISLFGYSNDTLIFNPINTIIKYIRNLSFTTTEFLPNEEFKMHLNIIAEPLFKNYTNTELIPFGNIFTIGNDIFVLCNEKYIYKISKDNIKSQRVTHISYPTTINKILKYNNNVDITKFISDNIKKTLSS